MAKIKAQGKKNTYNRHSASSLWTQWALVLLKYAGVKDSGLGAGR